MESTEKENKVVSIGKETQPMVEDRHNERMQVLINRYQSFAGWYLISAEIGLGADTMIRELYTQMAINNASLNAMFDILKRGRSVRSREFGELMAQHLENRLTEYEQQYNVKINQEDCGPITKTPVEAIQAEEESPENAG